MDHLTVEQVDKEVEQLEKQHGHKLIPLEGEGMQAGAFDPAKLLQNICAAVTIAVPILKFAIGLFSFFKPAWKAKLQNIIDGVALGCSSQE